ncbi:myosin light chain, putative [Plasmodium ovale curtisi]|uniref:Myosin light chain, putative n=1 Tax=Plasmodium ovale curtisi TaxID=864141 RepID=A0A1A8VZR9_PLAOA|nr:myosin light chain, putative [Plasmodium ovale curtisi]
MQDLTNEVELTSLFTRISDGSKTISSEDALDIVYQMGLVPSKEDIAEFAYLTNGVYTLSSIKKFCRKLKSQNCSPEGLIDLFTYYDVHKTGKVSREKMKQLFTTVGSKLSNKEMDTIISELCNDSERIDYRDFLNKYTSSSTIRYATAN